MARIVLDAREVRALGRGERLRALLHRLPRLAPEHVFVALVAPADVIGFGRSISGVEAVAIGAGPGSLRERFELGRVLRRAGADLLDATPLSVARAGGLGFVTTATEPHAADLRRSKSVLEGIRAGRGELLVSSRAAATDLARGLDLPIERLRVVQPSVTLSGADGGAAGEIANAAFLRRVGLPGTFVLAFGEEAENPDIDLIWQAIAPLAELALAVVFRGRPSALVETRLEGAGAVRQRVRLLGEVSDRELGMLLRRAAGVVATGDSWSWPDGVLRALATGVPVVAARSGGLPELVGEAGLLVPPGAVDPLRSSLYSTALAAGPADRERMAVRSRERAARFGWERGAREVLASYQAVLGGQA